LMRCSLGFGILIITKFKTEAAAHWRVAMWATSSDLQSEAGAGFSLNEFNFPC
jgi:hypothetical protein